MPLLEGVAQILFARSILELCKTIGKNSSPEDKFAALYQSSEGLIAICLHLYMDINKFIEQF